MGNKKSRIIEVDNIQEHLNQCQQLGRRSTFCRHSDCSIYGPVHLVKYNGMEFMLGESREGKTPPLGSLHYLVLPNLLVVPEFTLLEDSNPIEVDHLINILVGVAELCRDCQVGVGRGRIGFAGKWGIVGENSPQWAYQEASANPQVKGVYLPPQQMINLSQGRPYRKSNRKKSDVFALGIMTLELIFKVNLSDVFAYTQFEMLLGPILEKLKTIKLEFGEALSNIIMGMIELDEESRLDFDELLQMIAQARGVNPVPQTSRRGSAVNNIPNTSDNSNICRTPTNKSPRHRKSSVVIGNNCSPFKVGCFSDNIRTPQRLGRTGKTPERVTNNFREIKVSPLKRDLRINARFDKENKLNNAGGYRSSKSPLTGRKVGVSPLSRR